MKLSNKFTLTRIVLSPVFFLLYFLPIWTQNPLLAKISVFVAFPLLGFMEFTDYLDGHYARKMNEVSDFGKLFDPFADVIVHLATFVCFMSTYGSYGPYMYPVILVLILYREMSQNFLRMVAVSKGTAIAARKGGKLKTVTYVVSGFYALFLEALVRLDMVPACFSALKIASLVLFILCVVLSYISFIDYLIHFGKVLKQ
ncbi:MAG: CDP-diacylglycerol--glycerol-3-phosphate 3-phosphatidyltransferase [Treponema sp.]|nr:CDP-diacylglycerol--glycerol-3-phosphate 3-phosphatidyltransferase [Treponema sp.]